MACRLCECSDCKIFRETTKSLGKQRRISKPGDGRSKRGLLCRQIMIEQGLKSIMEASAFIREHRLYSRLGE